MKGDLFEDIIKKNFEGTATAQEKGMLLNWLKGDGERQELFFYYLIKRETERPQHLPSIDKIAEYEMFLRGDKSRQEIVGTPQQSTLRRRRSTVLRIGWAAALILVVLSMVAYAAKDFIFFHTYYSQAEGVRAVALDDGSVVILNTNSSLRVPRNFPSSSNREVWVEGEAFFHVSRKEDLQKFIVHTGDLEVQVLGTKFNVNARGPETEVTLDEGKVKLVSRAEKVLVMKPGEQVSVSINGLDFKKKVVDVQEYTEWKSTRLSFESTPLSAVVSIIENYYGVTVTMGDSLLMTRQFTGTLPNDDLSLVLRAIAKAYDIQVERHGDRIWLKE